MREEAVLFGESLVGIITTPSASSDCGSRPAFIFLNSGISHRVGACCLHVKMARQLARMGFVAFRIDFSGIGDSPARGGNLSIEQRWVAETREAMDFLTEVRNVHKFILLGHCSGAAVAFLTASQDERVHGSVLINFPGPRQYLRYYVKLALASPKVWLRLSKVASRFRDFLKSRRGSLSGARNHKQENRFIRAIVDAALPNLAERRTKLFAIYCLWDPGFEYFKTSLKEKLQAAISEENLQVEVIPGMDHDFKLIHGQKRLCHAIQKWALQWEQA